MWVLLVLSCCVCQVDTAAAYVTCMQEAVRNSVCHNATVVANAIMHCGTTSDQFLRYVHLISALSFILHRFLFNLILL